jgi:hypothetical protein
MAIVGFEYSKMNLEKSGKSSTNLKVSNNIKLNKIEESQVKLGENSKVLKIEFTFEINYEPDIAHIIFDGFILDALSEEVAKKVLESWKETKKLSPEYTNYLLNGIYNKCTIDGIYFSNKMNLPTPIPLPKLNVSKAKQNNEKSN